MGTGREVGFGYTNDWFCYDLGAESWSAISSDFTTPRQYCTPFTIADTGYVFCERGRAARTMNCGRIIRKAILGAEGQRLRKRVMRVWALA